MFSPLRGVTSHRLSNGLRVLFREDPNWPLVSVQAWVGVGSVHEAESEAGLAHVLEHMVFKGTALHGTADISRRVEAQGGALNAETSKEYTHYYVDLPSAGDVARRQAGAGLAIHLMAELLCRASLKAGEWRKECAVILEEMKRRHDDAETMAWELLQEAVYADRAHARPVIGTPETVSSFSAETVRRFYRTHYTAANTLVVLAGDFKSREALLWIEQEFRSMPRSPTQARPQTVLHVEPQRRRLQKPVQQAYAVYGFPTPPATHPDQEALDLLAVLLGDGRNARLVHHIREEQKLVWSIGASNITQEGPGIFAIFAEFDAAKGDRVAGAVKDVLRGLKKNPLQDAEIRRAKNLVQTSWLQGYETFHNQAATIGAYALENHLDRLKQYLPKILSVDRRELERVIDRYFSAGLACAVVEP
jgi:zinc protease